MEFTRLFFPSVCEKWSGNETAHLQYANTEGGRPGRSGHMQGLLGQMVDIWGAMPDKNFNALSCDFHPMAGCQSVHKADDQHCSLFTTPGTDLHSTISCVPTSVYSISSRITSSPIPSPRQILHTESDEQLVVGTVWKRSGNEATEQVHIVTTLLMRFAVPWRSSEKFSAICKQKTTVTRSTQDPVGIIYSLYL